MTDHKPWPFDAWLKVAVIQFGLTPAQFWEMSLRDWLVLTQKSAPQAMGLEDLIKLEKDYEHA